MCVLCVLMVESVMTSASAISAFERRLVISGKSAGLVDELLRELEILLHAAPTTDRDL